MSEESTPVPEPAENKRGELLGTLATGQRVYDRPVESSHLKDHPEAMPLITEALSQVSWRDEIQPDKYTPFKVEFKDSLGKANVVPVPKREGIEVVYAPRVDHMNRPRMKSDGSGVLYSRWVKGITEDEVPDCHIFKMILTEPSNQTEETKWVQLITAFPTAGDAPQEAGSSWEKYPDAKNKALAYWEGIGADNPTDTQTNGHAFLYDEKQIATEYITTECPYDRIPNPTSQ